MLRVRTVVILALLMMVIYALAPVERKRRWLDKLREFVKALAVSIVIYWIYMFFLYFTRR